MQVVIGEDDTLLREGLQHVLTRGGFDVVAAVADAPSLLAAAAWHTPDLVVTDIRMPPGNTDDGLQAALQIRQRAPGTAVVLLSQHVQRRYALELLAGDPGGIGYLLKQRISDIPTFCENLRQVGAGGTALDPDVVALILSRARHGHAPLEALTPRQLEVLALMAEGRGNAAIAHALSISEKAVVAHASRIYEVLGLPVGQGDHRRVLAVLAYLT
jgi:DNA-binding NarL/FixJ family response regulator